MKKSTMLAALIVCAACNSFAGVSDPVKDHSGIAPGLTAKKNNSSFMKSDEDRTSKQVIKLNLTQLALKNVSLQYEYGFHKNFSGALGLNFFLPRALPGFFAKEDPEGEGLRNTRYNGFGITPEFRFYPGHKVAHQAPHGFYIAAYLRYAKYSLTSAYNVEVNNKIYAYDMKASYKGYTTGLMIGNQWIIGKHFSLDLWIIGAGSGKAKLKMDAVGTGFNMNQSEQDQVQQSIKDQFDDVKYLGGRPTVETTSNSAHVNITNLPMLSFRTVGLTLGFAF